VDEDVHGLREQANAVDARCGVLISAPALIRTGSRIFSAKVLRVARPSPAHRRQPARAANQPDNEPGARRAPRQAYIADGRIIAANPIEALLGIKIRVLLSASKSLKRKIYT
jgi:hypothetical protein